MPLPPGLYRADHVGSLLRPAALKVARQAHLDGKLSAKELRAVEDELIRDVVEKQIRYGLRSITDGEFRRAYFHLDFLKEIDGVEVVEKGENHGPTSNGAKASKDGFAPPTLSVKGKLSHGKDIQVADFTFLRDTIRSYVGKLDGGRVNGSGTSVTQPVTAKVSIPSPTMVHFRGGRASIDIDAYPQLEPHFFDDLAAVYQAEIDVLYRAGARFVQLDDTNLAYLCDENMRRAAVERGDDPNLLPKRYAELINAAISKRPKDLVVGIHLCKGNYRSQHFASGGYAPVAEVLFKELDVDAYFLEYDDARSGNFEPLRHLPDGKFVVLGLMSSKVAEVQDEDGVLSRIREAKEHVPGGLERMCLSHQCGFSSTQEGNELTEEQQWKKIAAMVGIAKKVWGQDTAI